MKIKLLFILMAALFLITACAKEVPQTDDATVTLSVADHLESESLNIVETDAEETKTEQKDKEDKDTESTPTEIYTSEEESTSAETENMKLTKSIIASMTLEEKVAQLFVVTPDALAGDNEAAQTGVASREAFNKVPVSGIVYFSKNLQSEVQTRELLADYQRFSQERLNLLVFNCVDEEGGTVARIAANSAFEAANVGDMADIGATGDASLSYEAGLTISGYLTDLGFNMNFAPVADVLINAENKVIGKRSFGSDANIVAQMVISQLRGLKEGGVTGVVKHFPGHGATAQDTHNGEAYTDSTLAEMFARELIPFQAAIDNGVEVIMIGHFTAPRVTGDSTPCSLSGTIMTDILRMQMGYEGIVITDALNMGAITQSYESAEASIKAIEAGVDLLLMPEDFYEAYEGVLEAVKSGRLSEERINESLMRIISLKLSMEQE